MAARPLFSSPLFWSAAFGVTIAIGFGCSSSSSSPSGGGGGVDGGSSTNDAGTALDSASDSQSAADASHDGPPPDALYGACAVEGSFGSPCTAAATGADPTECTDPNFSQCFVGGQGGWCTKACTQTTDCTSAAEDAGCAPASCNSRGFCK